MEDNNNILKQDPLFNLTRLDFFNLSLKSDNLEWEKYTEEMLLLRYINFRYSFIYKNYEMLLYFLHLVEGNLLVFKSQITLDVILSMKRKLIQRNYNIHQEYIQIVNLCRVIYTYIIQLLYDNNVRLNANCVQKFLVHDSEVDLLEKKEVGDKLIQYTVVNRLIDTSKKIDMKIINASGSKPSINGHKPS